nr:immunoglobulin heavy chain junction region [Macaca mulatta]
CSRKEDSLDVW